MSDDSVKSNENEMAPDEEEWENRVLCRDESCIGVIGPDGRCKECGKTYDKLETEESNETQTDSAPDDDFNETEPVQKDSVANDWENRTLCSDESCIGVIGPDGRCKECGKPYKG